MDLDIVAHEDLLSEGILPATSPTAEGILLTGEGRKQVLEVDIGAEAPLRSEASRLATAEAAEGMTAAERVSTRLSVGIESGRSELIVVFLLLRIR